MNLKKLNHLRRMGSLAVVTVILTSMLVTFHSTEAAGAFEIKPATGHYDETTNIEIFNATAGTVLELYDATGQRLKSVYADGTGYGKFSDIKFTMAGDWKIKDVDGNQQLTLTVNPAVTITITVSPGEIMYTKGAPSVDISGTVTAGGSPVEGALVTVYWLDEDGTNHESGYSDVTGADGTYATAVFGLKGVGHYNVTVEKDLTGGPENEIIGFAHLPKVTSNDFSIEDVSAESVVHRGFTGMQEFSIKYSDDNNTLDWSKPMNVSLTVGDMTNYTGYVSGIDLPASIFIGESEIEVDRDDSNLTLTGKWPVEGTWTLMVGQSYEGEALIEETIGNHSYEYIGTATFTVLEPVDLSVDVLTPTLDVKSISTNSQPISIKIIGESETEFGDEAALTDNGNISLTNAIAVSGDILYTVDENDYTYKGDGTWDIMVFPAIGGGDITIAVTWPDRAPVTKTVSIGDGRVVTIDHTEVVVDTPVNMTATVTTSTGAPLTEAIIDLIYEGESTPFQTITGDETENNGLDGVYVFTVTTTKPHTSVIVYVKEAGKYAYAKFWSGADNDLTATISPAQILSGENTEFTINITKNGNPVDANLYILNGTELAEIHDELSALEGYTPITPATNPSTGNYTYKMHFLTEETYHLYVVTSDKAHDNLNGEPSFIVTKATVTATPTMLAKKVDTNSTVTFTVRWNNQDVTGTLKIMGIDPTDNTTFIEDGVIETEVINGTCAIHNVAAVTIGNITFEFKPEAAGSAYYITSGDLKIVPPVISVSPSTTIMGVLNEILITVTHPGTNSPTPDLDVTALIPGISDVLSLGTTNSAGKLSIGIVPTMTGLIKFFVEDDPVTTTIPVQIGMEIKAPEKVNQDEEITIKVLTIGGKPVSGATVSIDGVSIGATDAAGKITYKAAEKGTHAITATHSTYLLVGPSEFEVVEEEGVPGFEAVAILAAFIGAILFFYHRRK